MDAPRSPTGKSETMHPPFSAGAVVYAKDIRLVSRFYAEVAGLAIADEAPEYVILESPACQLAIVAMPPRIAERVAIAAPPVRRENTAIKLCLAVADIATARTAAAALGGGLNPPENEWEFRGARVCDGHDPEGNVIQVHARAR